eukprot:gene17893-24285_t
MPPRPMGAQHNKIRASDSGGTDSSDEDPPRTRSKKRSSKRELDSYGFPLGRMTEQQTRERQIASRVSESNASKWNFMESSKGNINVTDVMSAARLKKLVRKGIPARFRGPVWMSLSGAAALKASKPSTYFENVSNPKSKSAKRDLPRTFPEQAWVASEEGQESLRYVLVGFSTHFRKLGYCQALNWVVAMILLCVDKKRNSGLEGKGGQGLNFVAAMILLCVDKNEEHAFWLLVALADRLLYPNTYARQLDGCHVEMRSLEELLKEKFPKLHRHMGKHHCSTSVYSADWFLCLFLNNMPTDSVLHILDAVFNEGSKILHRVGIAILKRVEKQLLATNDPGIPDLKTASDVAASAGQTFATGAQHIGRGLNLVAGKGLHLTDPGQSSSLAHADQTSCNHSRLNRAESANAALTRTPPAQLRVSNGLRHTHTTDLPTQLIAPTPRLAR